MEELEDSIEYDYSDDDSGNYSDQYHDIDQEREESKMINECSENKVWIKQVFRWLKYNETTDKKYFIIWDKEMPLKCTFILLKNKSDSMGTFSLTVSGKEPYFPFSPPEIDWIDPDLNFIDSFSVKYIESLRKDNWNICQNLDDVINKIYDYVSQIEKQTKEYDKKIVNYLYQISEISGIYPSTITSNLPKLGMLYSKKNKDNSYKGIGYSQGNIESWDINKWEEKKKSTHHIIKDLYEYLLKTKINENDLENIKYSAVLPYLSRMIKNSSIQEISKNPENYIMIYKFGNWLYNNFGLCELHVHLKEVADEIQYVNRKIEENSDLKEGEKSITSEYEKEIVTLSEQYKLEEKNIEDKIKKNYCDIMKPLQCGINESFVYHSFKKKEFISLNQNNWFRRLFTEWKDLEKSLPLHNDGSVFIRWGAEGGEAHLFKILIFPSLSTPYGGGAYEFDMYIPSDYPNTHPTMKFITTGGGTVRFNPNLYNCGKICLSLLGTWSGEKWNPKISNIYQVCVSILGLIFVEEPYFNEPGYQNSQGTEKGNSQSEKYNDNIKIQNIRYGIINMIKNPPKEFEDVIKKHYEINIDRIKKQISEWITKSREPKILKDLLIKLNNLI